MQTGRGRWPYLKIASSVSRVLNAFSCACFKTGRISGGLGSNARLPMFARTRHTRPARGRCLTVIVLCPESGSLTLMPVRRNPCTCPHGGRWFEIKDPSETKNVLASVLRVVRSEAATWKFHRPPGFANVVTSCILPRAMIVIEQHRSARRCNQ